MFTGFGRNIGGLFRSLGGDISLANDDINNGDGSSSSSSNDEPIFQPSYADVLAVKALLGRVGHLPLELVDSIIDLAEYWPHTTVERRDRSPISVSTGGVQNGNVLMCRTPPLGFCEPPPDNTVTPAAYATARLEPRPLPRPDPDHPGHDASCLPDTVRSWLPVLQQAELREHPCRKIVFTLRSHDQGWANNHADKGTYRGSYSWFDVGLERFSRSADSTASTASTASPSHPVETPGTASRIPPDVKLYTINPVVGENRDSTTGEQRYFDAFPLLPEADCLQKNRVATRQFTEHKIEWKWTDSEGSSGGGDGDGDGDGEQHPLEALGRGRATGDGKFVRNLCVGDVVTVWAKARFPGWMNVVHSVKVDVYWAV